MVASKTVDKQDCVVLKYSGVFFTVTYLEEKSTSTALQ